MTYEEILSRWNGRAIKYLSNEEAEALIELHRDALLQKDEVLEALRELVHGVEDNWNHVGRCEMGTNTPAPVPCECGRDALLDEPLEILARIRPSAEKRNHVSVGPSDVDPMERTMPVTEVRPLCRCMHPMGDHNLSGCKVVGLYGGCPCYRAFGQD